MTMNPLPEFDTQIGARNDVQVIMNTSIYNYANTCSINSSPMHLSRLMQSEAAQETDFSPSCTSGVLAAGAAAARGPPPVQGQALENV